MSAPLEIPLKEIKSVTNNFDDANFIGEGFLGKIYKGRLSLSSELVDVAVRRLDNSFRLQELAFEKEISILSRLKHKNMVSIVGFCYEDNEMLIINERVARGSLRRRLSDQELTWTRRLQISVGAVRALSYLHNSSIIHHSINTNTILVDENWEAKISGFEYSMTIPAGDLDLAYEKLGIGIYKSDVFSIGIVLFELLCGKKAFVSEDNNRFQTSLAIFNYENRTVNDLVDPDLFSQMDPLSFKIFSETAYSCLNNQRSPPTMDEVLKRLERALKVQQRHENNETSTVNVERTIPDHLSLKLKSIEHMRIPLADILLATENFTKGGIVSAGGYGSVYEAELDHVDKSYCFANEWKNDREVPKKRSKVAIKRIIDTEDEIAEQGFFAEIKMLTCCKHSSIITLLGFCDEGSEMILIYEYASNGSLNYHLQNKSNNYNDSWAQRVKICLDVAKGLSFLHTTEGDRREIVHRDIKSANILLDENFEAKIGDFGLSLFSYVGKQHYTRYTREVAGTIAYMDPQYYKDAKLKKELDVYSFGVVLFEVLCGAVTYHRKYAENNKRGLALIARQHFKKGTIHEIVDPKIKEEINESLLTSIIGHDQKSLDTFTKIAYKCLAEAQEDRPTMKVVVDELEKALFFQTNRVKKVQLQEILVATNHFSFESLIQEGELGNLYKGKLFQSGKLMDIVARRFNRKNGQGDVEFQTEISMLSSLKHKNIISIFGAVDENGEKIVIYDLASHGTLYQHLIDPTLNWSLRLQICLGVARALSHIHYDVIHCDINSSKIFLDKDWEPKIFGFEFSTNYPQSWRHRLLYSRHFHDTMTPKFDVHCFGVLMLEILRWTKPMIREDDVEEEADVDLVDPNLRKQIDAHSFNSFLNIAKTCLKNDPMKHPTMNQIVKKLGEELEPQWKDKNLEHSAADRDASTKRQLNVACWLSFIVYLGPRPLYGLAQWVVNNMNGSMEIFHYK
ncbi:uncharacterized protein LOC143604099 [Bidens hawaiensis]|uniref:uncharacterized protein LOC143604099 n=1 Tax=Bidens hawaiensis TaxID=980011 RepID=UPI00404A5425